ncbi:hypothetical protein DPV78_008855 [Talaromyces pinophilus]|nr:hypothetical protein DPV78_008855 [Talaromyces pinophilus]
MARRYEIEELLWLRDSPLVTKPDKLPPVEEWMGPIPDPTARKPNHRDQNQGDSPTAQRRPSLFGESRHISRNSNSEDIVLGPPKTAFASASRIHGKGTYDNTERPARYNDTEEGKGDRFNFRDKTFKDREGADRDGRFGGPNGRRNDREDWNSGRPRRTFGQEEGDQRPRRNGDSKWEPREKQDELGLGRNLKDKDGRYEKEGRFDKDGRFVKGDTPLRSRQEKSWFRDETTGGDGVALEEEKPFMREREWRRDRPVPDRDWNRSTRVEQDPEWMDSTDRDESKRIHTQEDFQRWKERMKAGSSTPAQPEEKRDATPEQASPDVHKVEANHLDGELFAASKGHLPVDANFGKFFGILGESKQPAPEAAVAVSPLESIQKDLTAAKSSKSRFAGLFSPPPDTSVKGPEPVQAIAHPERPASTDADQEGFQRILAMLGGSKSRNTTPQVDSSQQPRPPSYVMREQGRPTPPPGLPSPTRNLMNRPDELLGGQETAPRGMHPPPGMEGMLPRDPQPHFNDRENLLRLMQQVNLSSPTLTQHGNAPPPSQMGQSGHHTPGILNVPDLLSRPQGMQKGPRNQTFLDDPAIANMQRPDSGLKGQQVRKPPVDGPPQMRYFDMPFPGAQGAQGPTTPGAGRDPQLPPSHMGIRGPPGFGQMPPGPPPGWAGQMLPQQGALGPPPGIPNTGKGMNPNFMAGPMSMHGGNMPPPPPPNDNSPPFMRGNAGANFGLPPGMMPPPGYMNMNGPLPPPSGGFMPGPHSHEAMLNMGGQNGGGFGGGSAGGPPPSSRHLLEMLAHANGGAGGSDGRGAMLGGPGGQYR